MARAPAFQIRFRALTTDLSQIKAARAGMTQHILTYMEEFMTSVRDEIREYPGEASGITEFRRINKRFIRQRNFRRSSEYKRLAEMYPEDVADFDPDVGRAPHYKPYKRTYTLYRGWYIPKPVLNRSGARVVLLNSAGDKRATTNILGVQSRRSHLYADFVQGVNQQPYHRATGWINVPEHIAKRDYRKRYAKDLQLMLNDKYFQMWWKEGRKAPQGVWGSKFSIRSHFLNPHYNVGTIYGGM